MALKQRMEALLGVMAFQAQCLGRGVDETIPVPAHPHGFLGQTLGKSTATSQFCEQTVQLGIQVSGGDDTRSQSQVSGFSAGDSPAREDQVCCHTRADELCETCQGAGAWNETKCSLRQAPHRVLGCDTEITRQSQFTSPSQGVPFDNGNRWPWILRDCLE